MKKLVFSLAAAAAILSACQMTEMEGDIIPSDGVFRLNVAIENIDTKTVLDPDGYKLSWADGDALSVVAKYSDGTYASYRFDKSATGENLFECEDFIPEGVTEYHVFYPYSEEYSSIGEDGFANAAVTVGAAADAAQTGEASGVGSNAPLCGYAAVTDGNIPAITLGHVSTLFAITVLNNAADAITVSKVSVDNSADAAMTGTYYVNSGTGAIAAGETNATASVTPAAAVSIESGKSAVFYIVSAPFALQQNDYITTTVTTTLGDKTFINKVMDAQVDFEAGKYNTTSVNVTDGSTYVNIRKADEGEYAQSMDFTASNMFEKPSETLTVSIQSNAVWTIETPEWISVDKIRGGQDVEEGGEAVEETVTFTIDNTAAKVTDGTDVVTSEVKFITVDKTATLNVTQQNSYSNCYVVNAPGTYTIPAGKPDGTPVNASSVTWMFETENGLISGTAPTLADGKITFTVAESNLPDVQKGGYGIITLMNGGEVAWSYAIWYTNEIRDIQIGNYTVMDRNLLAWTDNLPAEDFGNQSVPGSYGCLFQWGSKNPLPCPSQTAIDGITENRNIEHHDEMFTEKYFLKGNFNTGFKNPDGTEATYYDDYGNNDTEPMSDATQIKYPWLFWNSQYSNTEANRWSDTQKTVNDPCPTGYKVPAFSQMTEMQSLLNKNGWSQPFKDDGQENWSKVYTMNGVTFSFMHPGWVYNDHGTPWRPMKSTVGVAAAYHSSTGFAAEWDGASSDDINTVCCSAIFDWGSQSKYNTRAALAIRCVKIQ